MAYFEELSDYTYAREFVRPGTKAVGWLARGHGFPTATPDESLLDLLWSYCSICVARSRGGHFCEFCPPRICQVERHGERLMLGTAEIRVFSREGRIYASPTLIYHYVAVHHYKPPDEFLQALREGPRPPSREYFDALAKVSLQWGRTTRGGSRNRIRLYLQGGSDSRNYLDKIGTLNDIERTGIKLEEGLTVPFYCPDPKDQDDLLFEGTVHFDSEKAQWYAIIDEKSYRHESESLAQADKAPL